MAWFQIGMRSEVLSAQESLMILTPELGNLSAKIPTFFFLHGLGMDSSEIFRKTNLELYVQQRGFAIVTAYAGKSFYTNMVYGDDYQKFFEQELISFLKQHFSWFNSDPNFNYIGGISMGGFGAIKLGINNPSFFKKIISISAPIHFDIPGLPSDLTQALTNAFGENYNTSNSLTDLRKIATSISPRNIPPINLYCGSEDSLYLQNSEFDNLLTDQSITHTFDYWNGQHDWDFWNQAIAKVTQTL
jgi:S-formylglutathione hydrolase FrmB